MSEEWTIEDLVTAVREHCDLDDEQRRLMRDVAEHGADTGWPGFTYTRDCCEFFDKHASEIWGMLVRQAEDLGHKNACELIATFARSDMVEDWDTFRNLLAWWALEEAARYVAEQTEGGD